MTITTSAPEITADQRPAEPKPGKDPYMKYAWLYLALTLGSVWGLAIFYGVAWDFAVSVFGPLELFNPLVIIILHMPGIAGILMYGLYDGWRGIANFFRTLVPRPRDWILLGALAVLMFGYVFVIRFGAQLVGFAVPAEPEPIGEMLLIILRLFIAEVGMIAVALGWFGFFLPLMNRRFKNPVGAGIATGMGIAVFLAPGNLFASFELATAWPLYATQLSVLGIGMSMLISRMKGNALFFLVPFWISASGSHLGLYYFDAATQLVQIVVFGLLVLVLWFVLKRENGGRLRPLHTFPEFVEHEYTVAQGAVFAGVGDKSKETATRTPEPTA